MHKALTYTLVIGSAVVAASLSNPTSATPTPGSVQQSEASIGTLELAGYRRYRRHAYRHRYYRPYSQPYYYRPYAYYRPYPYYYRPYYRPGLSFWFGF